MPILNDQEITELCHGEPPLVSGFLDWDQQLQPAGFDLTLAGIVRPLGDGIISVGEGKNFRAKFEPFEPDVNGYYHLSPGYYVIDFNELVQLPRNITAVAYTRTTLIRYGGQVLSGLWDAGFSGKSRCGLVVHSPRGIILQRNAMLIQMVFHRLSGDSEGFRFNYLYQR